MAAEVKYIILAEDKSKKATDSAVKGNKGLIKSFVDVKAAMDVVSGAFKLIGKAVGFAVNQAKELTSIYIEQARADTKLQAILKSTGNQIGTNTAALKEFATELQDLTGIGDEVIQGSQAMLLTFTKIGGDVFPRATKAALDMSEIFGNLQSATVQIGKALQDPIQGVTALRRVGVQLSDQQTRMIKNFMEIGDIASAQKVILGELETQFGGLSEAIGNSFEGSVRKLKSNIGDIKEILGKQIADYIKPFIDKINEFVSENRQSIINVLSQLPEFFKVTFQFVREIAKQFWKDISGDLKTAIYNAFEGSPMGEKVMAALFPSFKTAKYAGMTAQEQANFLAGMLGTDPVKLEGQKSKIQLILDDYAAALKNLAAKNAETGDNLFPDIPTPEPPPVDKTAKFLDEQAALVAEYNKKVFEMTHDRIDILEAERDEVLAHAKSIGADTTDIEEYFSLRRIEIFSKEIEAKKKASDSFYNEYIKTWGAEPGAPVGDIIVSQIGGGGSAPAAAGAGIGGDAMGGFMASLGEAAMSIESVTQLMDPFSTILARAVAVVGPLVDTALGPLTGALMVMGDAIAVMIVPVLEALAPVIKFIAEAFVFLYNWAIRPLGNFVILLIKTVGAVIAGVMNAIVSVVNLFLTKKNELAYAKMPDFTTGYLGKIDSATLAAVGSSTAESSYSGAGAQYTAGRTLNITINVIEPLIVDDTDLTKLAETLAKYITLGEEVTG